MIGILVLNYKEYKQTIEFICHIKQLKSNYYLVVVDNNSPNESYTELKKYESENCKVIRTQKNGGYSYGNNYGMQWIYNNIKVEYVVIANPDTIFDDNYLKSIVSFFADNDKCGLITGIMLNKDSSIVENQIWSLPTIKEEFLKCFLLLSKICKKNKIIQKEIQFINCVPAGCCEVVRSKAFYEVSGFDENIFLFYEENVLAKKMKEKGYITGILTNCSYYHMHSTTINKCYSLIQKYKVYLNSMLYYNRHYNSCKGIWYILLFLCSRFALMEYSFYIKIKHLRPSND